MELATYLKNLLGEEFDAFTNATEEPPTVAVNRFKCDRDAFQQKLTRWGMSFAPHPANADGFILAADPLPLSHTLSYFCGEFRYQGISSQMPVLALDPQPGETVLDISAAPGSKSTQIAGLMQNRGRLLLNDFSMKRLEPLLANLSRAAVLNDVLINYPGQKLGRILPEFFDRVLVDAPCSALNSIPARMLTGYWNSGYLQTISHIQEQLLISAIKAARVNGIIVYSTCSLAPEENEMVLTRIIDKYPVTVEPLPDWLLAHGRPALAHYQGQVFTPSLQHGRRFYPFPTPMEGFFMIRLRKTGPLPIRPVNHPLRWIPTASFDDPVIAPILQNLQKLWGIETSFFTPFRFWVNEHKLWLTNGEWINIPENGFIKVGLPLAVRKSNFWRLTNASAQWLGERITRSQVELDPERLLQLLSAGKLANPGEVLKYYILTSKQKPIGVVSQCQGVMKLKIPHPFRLIKDSDI
jgi:16S rRNA (cytosine1407-C5)-methyltransferase